MPEDKKTQKKIDLLELLRNATSVDLHYSSFNKNVAAEKDDVQEVVLYSVGVDFVFRTKRSVFCASTCTAKRKFNEESAEEISGSYFLFMDDIPSGTKGMDLDLASEACRFIVWPRFVALVNFYKSQGGLTIIPPPLLPTSVNISNAQYRSSSAVSEE
jgi:hypothetical protein